MEQQIPSNICNHIKPSYSHLNRVADGSFSIYLTGSPTNINGFYESSTANQLLANAKWLNQFKISKGIPVNYFPNAFNSYNDYSDFSYNKALKIIYEEIKQSTMIMSFGPVRHDIEITIAEMLSKPTCYMLLEEYASEIELEDWIMNLPSYPYYSPNILIYNCSNIVHVLNHFVKNKKIGEFK